MTQNTKIEWADHTFNPWWGCTKVSPACDHCYAAALDKRTGGDHWGTNQPRKRTSTKNWIEPYKGYTVKTITHPNFGDKPVEVFAINVGE